MKCPMCEGNMEPTKVSHTIDRRGYHLFLEEIPAMVCVRCGEKVFAEREVAAIQDMVRILEEKLAAVGSAA